MKFIDKIFRSIADLIQNLMTSGLQDELSIEVLRKFIMLNLIAMIGILFLIPFGIFALASVNNFVGTIDLLTALLLFISAYYLRRSRNLTFSSYFIIIFMGLLFISLIISEDNNGSAHVWSFLYPLAVMFLLGRKIGAVISFIFILVIAIILFIPNLELHYATYFKVRFIGSFLALTLSTFLFESIRESTEKRMLEAIELAQRSDQLKSEFLAQMSHEIRTPINSIINFTSLLINEKQNNPTEEEKLYFGYIQNASARLIRTINLILNMSEIELDTYTAKLEKLDLTKSVIKPTCSEFQNEANEKGLKLVCASEVEENDLVEVDHYTITQSIVNLVDNAIKYTEDGQVTIKYFKQNGKYVVEVADTGVGISEEFFPQLFKKFSQEEQGYTRKFEGNGLGLALVKKYCDINNADINFVSKKGIGTTFTITI